MSAIEQSGELAQAIAAHAVECIGPNGTVLQVHEEDASLVRATFIARLAEAATKIANGEPL
ncbi:hypothetical protein DEU38_13470 [Rhodococcus sp. AG1013]|uniref:hypothetical protein n=1 Tax=Rhodococcus sp. AG1013 TaxID=2183996 RepID=UPI000E0B06B1|nr:hypothetical protein [Rhodococcus sp. AG1013]RDI13495.1 hypothetical protein DEU38_13470 [Rhodococcus sp. AG1013]